MKQSDVNKLAPGLYAVHWKRGGFSFAAVGVTRLGRRWLACTDDKPFDNLPALPECGNVWRRVKHVRLIAEPPTPEQAGRPTP